MKDVFKRWASREGSKERKRTGKRKFQPTQEERESDKKSKRYIVGLHFWKSRSEVKTLIKSKR